MIVPKLKTKILHLEAFLKSSELTVRRMEEIIATAKQISRELKESREEIVKYVTISELG